MRIPFDSLCLAAVVEELTPWVGARVQRVTQRDPLSVALELYAGREGWLFLSADAETARAHMLTRRPGGIKGEQPAFCKELRKRLTDGRLLMVRQRGLDRILELGFDGPEGDHQLIAELMGKHANLMLCDAEARVVAATKWVGQAKSKRPILPGKVYAAPPFEPKPPLTEARPEDDLRDFEGASPFLVKLIESGLPLQAAQSGDYGAWYVHGSGAYPLPLDTLELQAVRRDSLSQALEQHFVELERNRAIDRERQSLRAQLTRVLKARKRAIRQLEGALDAASKAGATQLEGELILAYQGQIEPGASKLQAWDYEGNEVQIKLDPEKNPIENAQVRFEKAKRAKAGADGVGQQRERMVEDAAQLEAALAELETVDRLDRIRDMRTLADKRKWLHHQVGGVAQEERPFQGKPIRELLAPGGWTVLYGENSEANDYLTTRVAKPNDWWLHVRGAASAHVVIRTANQPDRVSKEALLFAAEVAVDKSPSKHSSYVTVDYTLKKHVRKPRGSAPGFAVYEREKSLAVER